MELLRAGRAGRAAQALGTHTRRAPPRLRPSPRPRAALRGVARSLALRALGALPSLDISLARSVTSDPSGPWSTRCSAGQRRIGPSRMVDLMTRKEGEER